jgi:hypothetical protein
MYADDRPCQSRRSTPHPTAVGRNLLGVTAPFHARARDAGHSQFDNFEADQSSGAQSVMPKIPVPCRPVVWLLPRSPTPTHQ